MADTVYTWRIANLERELSDGYVYTSHWTVTASKSSGQTDDEGEPTFYTAGAYGSVGFSRPDNLIPYESLTEEIVIGWTKDALNSGTATDPETGEEVPVDRVAEIEAGLAAQIEQQINPTSATGTPWNG